MMHKITPVDSETAARAQRIKQLAEGIEAAFADRPLTGSLMLIPWVQDVVDAAKEIQVKAEELLKSKVERVE